jgi:hypothetical protein
MWAMADVENHRNRSTFSRRVPILVVEYTFLGSFATTWIASFSSGLLRSPYPEMTPALTANRSGSDSNCGTSLVWSRPARGFDDWHLREELNTADRLLADLERDLAAEQCARRLATDSTLMRTQPVAEAEAEVAAGTPSRTSLAWLVSALWPLGIAALLAGAGLVAGSFAAECSGLWDGGLAAMVIGQAVLLLASLADRRA